MQDICPDNYKWSPKDFAPPNQDSDQGVALGHVTLPFPGEPFCARDGRAISILFAHNSKRGNIDMGTSLTLGFVPGRNWEKTNHSFHESQQTGHPLRVFKSFNGRIMYRGVYVIRKVDRHIDKWYLSKLNDQWQDKYPEVQVWIDANIEHEILVNRRASDTKLQQQTAVGRAKCRAAGKRFFGALGVC